ncbi:ubiquitin carboxyl-terminal hydrolase, partial [Plasmodium malariae]
TSEINSSEGNLKLTYENVWFIKQTVPNSCGTIALFHVHCNLKSKFEFDKGSILDNFFDKVKEMTPEKRGQEFQNTKSIELLHHEFCGDLSSAGENNDVDTHFIVFLENDGQLIELDAGNIIQKVFIEKCQGDNRFSALAVVSSDDA